jgi:hypothetical protein
MSEILLVPVDAPVPVASESIDSGVPDDEPLPVKRSRGRPPGAKNKAKVEPPTPRNAAPRVPTPPQEDEEEVAPLPPPVKKRPKRSPVLQRVQPEDEFEPPSPRAQRRQIHIDAQARRHDHHTERVRGYSTMLDTMLGY